MKEDEGMKEKIVMQFGEDLTLEKAFEEFIQMKTVMNSSPETIKYYNGIFRYFTEFFGENRLCVDVNERVIIDYLMYIKTHKPNVSQKTVCTYIRGLRAILYFMMKSGYVENFKISLPKTEETIKETYTDNEIKRLIEKPKINKGCSFSELRNWALVCYFLATGNRLSTVCNIKISDVDFQSEEILIRKTKNKKQQIIPMSAELKSVLQEYLKYRKGEPDDYLFCNSYGERLNRDTMSGCISKYNHSRGVSKTSIHLFRHTFAKNWILNGGDIFRLQKVLGHSTLDMVKNYVAIYGGDLKRDYDKFSLLDRATHENGKGDWIKMK